MCSEPLVHLDEYISSKQLPAELIEKLRAYPVKEAARLCSTLNPSANALGGLLQLVDEIAKREGLSTERVFFSESLQNVLAQEQIPRKERLKKYRHALELRRYPAVAKINQTLNDNCQQLRSDCNLKFQLPKDLEGDSLSVSFTVRSPEDLLRYAKRLETAATHESTEKIFSVLRGDY